MITILDKTSGSTVFVGMASTQRGAEIICRRARVRAPVMRGTLDQIEEALDRPVGGWPSFFSYDLVRQEIDVWMIYEMFKGRRVRSYKDEHGALRYAAKHADSVPDGSGMAAIGGSWADLPEQVDDLDELRHVRRGSLCIIRIYPRTP